MPLLYFTLLQLLFLIIFVGKKGLDVMSALENHPKINAAIKSINAGLKLFGNNFTCTLYPK